MRKVLNLEKRIDVPHELVFKEINGNWVILSPKKPNWIITNEIGRTIVQYTIEGLSPKEIIIKLNKDKGIDVNEALKYVLDFFKDVEKFGFLESVESIDLDAIPSPTRLQLYVTNACNLRCKTCYMEATTALEDELTNEEWMKVISDFNEIVGPTLVAFSGGEPLYRDRFLDLAEYAKSKENETFLFTNGTLINGSNIEDLVNCIDKFQVSLDGTNSKSNDIVRGKGSYEKTINAIYLLGRRNVDLTISYTIVPQNIEDVKNNLVPFLESLGINNLKVGLSIAREVGRWRDNCVNSACLDKSITDLYPEVRKTLIEIFERGWDQPSYSRNILKRNCTFGQRLVIDSRGNGYPCAETVHSIGNVRNESLTNLYGKLKSVYRNSSVDANEPCKICDVKYICRGGCKTLRVQNFGSPFVQRCDDNRKLLIYRKLIDGSII